jgi:hypothetical protein
MTAIAKTFHHSRADRRITRSVWRDAGLGLAALLVVLSMTALGTRGRPDAHSFAGWQTIEQPNSPTGLDRNAAPVAFPLSPFTGYFD